MVREAAKVTVKKQESNGTSQVLAMEPSSGCLTRKTSIFAASVVILPPCRDWSARGSAPGKQCSKLRRRALPRNQLQQQRQQRRDSGGGKAKDGSCAGIQASPEKESRDNQIPPRKQSRRICCFWPCGKIMAGHWIVWKIPQREGNTKVGHNSVQICIWLLM